MKFIVLTALLCGCLCAGAQVHWALKAGGQFSAASYQRNSAKISTNSITGFHAGVVAKVYFDDKVAFVTGIQYCGRGYRVKTLPGDTLKTYRLNYADIPVMVQIDLSKNRGDGFYCKLGPSVGVGISGRETYTGANGMKVSNKAILSVTGNHFGLFDASLNAALGYSFKQKFFIEAGYMYGIGNIDNDPDGPVIKTRLAGLSAGYFFR